MSILVQDKPIAMWSDQELKSYLDELVCTKGTSADLAAIAESVARLLSRASTPKEGGQ